MTKTNYRTRLENSLSKFLEEVVLLKDIKTPLSDEYEKKLFANKLVIDNIRKASKLLSKDFDKAAALICDIPHYIVNPNPRSGKYKYVGSDRVYSMTDGMRHCIRMIAVDRDHGRALDVGKPWNNNLILLKG